MQDFAWRSCATPNKFGDAFAGPEMWASLTSNLQRAASNRSGSMSLSFESSSRLLINSMMPSLDLFGRCVVAELQKLGKDYPEAAQMISTAM